MLARIPFNIMAAVMSSISVRWDLATAQSIAPGTFQGVCLGVTCMLLSVSWVAGAATCMFQRHWQAALASLS